MNNKLVGAMVTTYLELRKLHESPEWTDRALTYSRLSVLAETAEMLGVKAEFDDVIRARLREAAEPKSQKQTAAKDHAIVETGRGKWHASEHEYTENITLTVPVKTLCGQRGFVMHSALRPMVAWAQSGVNRDDSDTRPGSTIECGNCNRIAEKAA